MFVDRNSTYTDYRIPAMVISEKGTIFVAFECRENQYDWAKIDIRIMKSMDGGDSFQEINKIYGNGNTMNNPVFIAKGDVIHFLYCENYRKVFHIMSDDGGNSWSEPREITYVFGKLPHTVVAVGPGHGVVTSKGTMVTPVWLAYNPEDEFAHKPSCLATIYSEDNGETWHCGDVIDNEELFDANETAIALTKDGYVLLSIRNRHPEYRQRYWTLSRNGYSEWKYLGYDERFVDPRCMGSLCNGGGKIFFSNCESTEKRENLTVKISSDKFESFDRVLFERVLIEKVNVGYSEVAYWNHCLYVLYETFEDCGGERINHRLHLKKIQLKNIYEQVKDRKI